MSKYPHVIGFSGKIGCGKCLSPTQQILMYDGTIKLAKDILVGDLLMGDDSTSRTVLSLATGKDEMYEIIPTKGRSYIVNSEHILTLQGDTPVIGHQIVRGKNRIAVSWSDQGNRHKKYFPTEVMAEAFLQTKTIDIFDISVKDYLTKSIAFKKVGHTYHVGADFPSLDLPIDPYLLGYWLGDGTHTEADISTADPEIIKCFNAKLILQQLCLQKQITPFYYKIINTTGSTNLGSHNTTGYNGLCKSKNGWQVRYILNNNISKTKFFLDRHQAVIFLQTKTISVPSKKINPFKNELQELNLINNKHIPLIYKANSRENRLSLLAGLIDSDGYVYGNCIEIVQKRKNLSEDIEYLALSLGFMATFTPVMKTCTNSKNPVPKEYFKVTIFGEGLENIPTILERKKLFPRQQIKNALKQMFTIKSLGSGTYNGFVLDGNSRFLLGDFTVTHNTYLAENVTLDYLSSQYRVAVYAFADHLKILCHIKDRISYERLFYDKDTESRLALQRVGMELREVDAEVFIRVIDCHLRLAKDRRIDVVLISDVRLLNEFEYILRIGGVVVRIDSFNRNANKLQQEVNHLSISEQDVAKARISSHISEINLDTETRFHRRINNDLGQEQNARFDIQEMLQSLDLIDTPTEHVSFGL